MDFENTHILAEKVVKMLAEKKLTIASAESCTGGLFAKLITDIPGSSAVFYEGYITYANEAKEKILGVSHKTLEEYGAVSEQTAYEMAEGLYKISKSDICCVFTGIAGPGGATAQKPVGLVYVGICAFGKVQVKRLQLSGNREQVRNSACAEVFKTVEETVKNM